MSRRFADLTDAGHQLGRVLAQTYGSDVVLLGVEPRGLVVAEAVGRSLGLRPRGLAGDATDVGTLTGTVLLVDDGVESGGTADRLGRLLRAAGATRLVLAVPVCPREPLAALQQVYDEVVALERPFMVRSLTWHYDTLD